MKLFPLYGALAALLATAQPVHAATPAPSAPRPLTMLKAQGTSIVDGDGRKVTLRGFNLGGWLVEEMWMQPFVTTPPAGTDSRGRFTGRTRSSAASSATT